MTVFDKIDGKRVSHMAEADHTDTPGDETDVRLALKSFDHLSLPPVSMGWGSEWEVPQVRRSRDLSSLTSSAAHWRASVILPASLKASAFARA